MTVGHSSGGYSAYLLQREMADARAAKVADTATESIARERELVQRYRSHRKYAKMHEHERRLEALEERRVEAPRRGPSLALSHGGLVGGGPVRSGDLVVGLRDEHGSCRRPSGRRHTIVRVDRLEAQRGDRIGIVGPNGRQDDPLRTTPAVRHSTASSVWELRWRPAISPRCDTGSFPGATVLAALLAQVNLDNGPARSYLARFLFRGDDVFKPVAELSGGERSRLELALLGITPANLLLLDEPTNHLDIPAREALESFLRESPATLLVVSHDRRLLETICDRLWVVEAVLRRAGPAATFDGGHRAWRRGGRGWTIAGELEIQSRRLDTGATVGLANGSRPAAALGRPPRRRRLRPRRRRGRSQASVGGA